MDSLKTYRMPSLSSRLAPKGQCVDNGRVIDLKQDATSGSANTIAVGSYPMSLVVVHVAGTVR